VTMVPDGKAAAEAVEKEVARYQRRVAKSATALGAAKATSTSTHAAAAAAVSPLNAPAAAATAAASAAVSASVLQLPHTHDARSVTGSSSSGSGSGHSSPTQQSSGGGSVHSDSPLLLPLHQQPFHLTLMDLFMPIMDGLESTAAIRASALVPPQCQPSIVALTANAMSGDKDRCIAAGMNSYLTKPIVLQALTAALKKVWIVQQKKRSPRPSSASPNLAVRELIAAVVHWTRARSVLD